MTNIGVSVFWQLKLFQMNHYAVNRYTDQDLEAFKRHIEAKLAAANEQYQILRQQLEEAQDNQDEGFDLDEDSVTGHDLEMLSEMSHRQSKYMRDLEAALVRIRLKTYGICEVTGQLIDKKRLMAVPITTKSMAAKVEQAPKKKKVATPRPANPVATEKPAPKLAVQEKPKSTPSKIETKFQDFGEDDFDQLEDEDWIFVEFDDQMDSDFSDESED